VKLGHSYFAGVVEVDVDEGEKELKESQQQCEQW